MNQRSKRSTLSLIVEDVLTFAFIVALFLLAATDLDTLPW